ncbi:MAG: hypothetical protein HF982_00370 [Desulfobacteraceae bacterium]|nr:hypothetical protein [Desulfobacteraceae bacterium]MBC2718056.1 hypothetical protein [Desulfobacteraceae bacterium]
MEIISFKYIFDLPEGRQVQMDIQLDSQSLNIINNCPYVLPEWAALDFYQCPHCPLSVTTHTHCPLAANLVNIIKHLDTLHSYHQIRVKVVMKNRTITQDTTIQKGLSSLMGLLIATSGCPHTTFFKSMARFHLPLADEDETISRVTSMYLLAQYFLRNEGKPADFDLKGLMEIYDNMHMVNATIAKRLRAASKTDSAVNAIVLLDVFTFVLPLSIKTYLQKIRHLFDLDG